MELFGYVCSPLCKNKADQLGIKVPVYAGQRDLVAARSWNKIGLIFGSFAALIVLFLAVWTWYAWFGSVPHPYFTVKFADTDRAYAGKTELVGKDQIVFLHGGTLARYDLKTKKKIWSKELISKQELDDVIQQENKLEQAANSGSGYHHWRSPTDIQRSAKLVLQSELQLRVADKNIWVGEGNSLTHYDWDTGKVLRQINLPENGGELIQQGNELLAVGDQSVTHISLVSGDSHIERFGGPGGTLPGSAQSPTGGLASSDNNKPLNPQKVGSQVQNLTTPGRIALPALLANAEYERKLEAAMNDDKPHSPPKSSIQNQVALDSSRIVYGGTGFAQFSVRLLQQHLVTRNAMKTPSKKSVLNGNVNVTQTADVANEMLNDMQRERGGGTVTEDESTYQVTVHLPGSPDVSDWTGKVIGPPQLFVLKSVNVIAAGKQVIVLDKSNKKLWDAKLTYNVPSAPGGVSPQKSQFGEGPCVEHGSTLYVFDQAVLTAFNLHSGNARWRLPSVGIVGLFFDDQDDLYVNTTTGNPDDIKYSRQIDVTRKKEAVLFKIDAKTGKTLWKIKPGGYISYVSGKFIYTIQSYDPNPLDLQNDSSGLTTVIQRTPYLRIARIRPSDGRLLWDYEQDRCPVDARFDQNSIELVYKKEVQVLRYLTF